MACDPTFFSPKMCSAKPVLPEEVKISGCLCSKYLTSLLRHVYVNRLVWTLVSARKDFDPRTSGDFRHFDTTVRCAAHYANHPPPLDLSFWSFLTFLYHGIAKVKRHLLCKFR